MGVVGTRGRSWKKVSYFGAPENHILIMSRRYPEGKLFVGRLAKRTRTRDLEDAFEKYGRLLRCELKFGGDNAYAFIDFEDKRDAEDAMHGENGREICGARVVIEWAKGGRRMMNRGDECYRCQRFGHRARDCPELYDSRRRGGRSRSRERRRRSRSRSRDRRRRDSTRSRSRSPKRRRTSRSGSRDDSRDRSKSRDRSTSRNKSTSPQKDRKEQSKSRSRSRSRSRKDSGRQSRSRSKSAGRSKSRSRSPRSKSKSKSRSRSR